MPAAPAASEVRRKLLQRKLPPEIVDATVARMIGARLLDDADYARSFTETRDRTSPRSQRLIVQELRAAGVATNTAALAVADISDTDAAYRLAEGRLRSLRNVDEAKFRSRLGSLLQRRGFAWDVVRTTVDRCWAEASEEESDALE